MNLAVDVLKRFNYDSGKEESALVVGIQYYTPNGFMETSEAWVFKEQLQQVLNGKDSTK